MRITIDIDEEQIRALDMLSEATKRPRAELIRDAVDQYLAGQSTDAFGLWGDRKVDGLAYQEKTRGEW
jgi:predicted transcriptional regulator